MKAGAAEWAGQTLWGVGILGVSEVNLGGGAALVVVDTPCAVLDFGRGYAIYRIVGSSTSGAMGRRLACCVGVA